MATANVAEPVPAVRQPSELAAEVERYAIGLGWPLLVRNDRVYLPTNLGIVGLSMTAGLGGEVNAEFVRHNLFVPILAVSARPARWIFLTETPPTDHPVLPARVDLINGHSHIPLPLSVTPDRAVRWICEPTKDGRRVPSFVAALSAVRQVALTGRL